MSGRRAVAIFATFLVAAFATTTSIVLDFEMGNANREIAQLQAQLSAQQRASQRAQVRFEGELAAERAAFSQAEARIGGTHRDLITCADWQYLVMPVSGIDSFSGQISATAGPPSLPQHCINQ